MQNHLARNSRGRLGRVVLMWSLLVAVGGAAQPARAQYIYFPLLNCLNRAEETRLDCKASDDYVDRIFCDVEFIFDLMGCFSGIE